MKRSIHAPWLVAASATVTAVLVQREQRRIGRPFTSVLPELVAGLALIAAGLVVRRSRATNRCWVLLVTAGFAWFVGDFEHARNGDVATAAFAMRGWQGLFLAWTVLAYPTGRLQSRRDRGLVAAIAALFTARSISRLFLHVPPDVAGYGTRNRFLPISDERWWRLVEDVFAWSYAIAVTLVLASTSARWIGSTVPARHMRSPVLFAGVVVTASVVYEYVVGWNAEVPRTTDVRINDVVLWAHVALAAALAIGIWRVRGTRHAVIDLVTELGDGMPPPRLAEALARALGDPSLQLLTWSASHGAYVDHGGRTVDGRSLPAGRALTAIEHRTRPVAALLHDAALLEDPGLVNAVVAAVRLTIDNEQLHAELASQLAEIVASRARIVAAGDEQRRRIERDLHDGAQQRLVTIALALRLAETRLADDADPAVRDALSQGVKELGAAIDELRDLARGVHPANLTESGLAAALNSLIDRTPIAISTDIDVADEPPSPIGATAYFAVAEALTNVLKHADATTVHVTARMCDDVLHVSVTDDGVGGAKPIGGSGLRGIGDRVAAVGGSLRIDSRPGSGTQLQVELPCASS